MNANLFAIIRERVGSQANVLLRTVEGAVVTYGDMLERIRISGEGVTAVVVKQTAAALSEDSIRDALAERLAKFKLPKRVLFVDQLPRNSMGKVQKNLLRGAYLDLYAPCAAAERG